MYYTYEYNQKTSLKRIDISIYLFILQDIGKNKSIYALLFVLVFDHVEVQYHREAKWDKRPWIFVSIEIVEMYSSLVQYDWLIPNNDSVILVWLDTEWKQMGKVVEG